VIIATAVCFLSLILFSLALAFFGMDENGGLLSNKTILKIS
jgi:hypothetical protein